jgi:hypothetical protein
MKIQEITVTNSFGVEVHILITNEDGSQISMLKSTYDAIQAEQSTPIVAE